ncbi:hypothetical protein ANN_08530 [Periplaneta americana]|uniref:DUF4817 domain-containing protein n=1 Tax=Periplaneta americana TaxID=6978 RepID=A0ABQ8T2V5_PERAM|nr:hypothetical protein ANN_08530 [Periplaneta americana]
MLTLLHLHSVVSVQTSIDQSDITIASGLDVKCVTVIPWDRNKYGEGQGQQTAAAATSLCQSRPACNDQECRAPRTTPQDDHTRKKKKAESRVTGIGERMLRLLLLDNLASVLADQARRYERYRPAQKLGVGAGRPILVVLWVYRKSKCLEKTCPRNALLTADPPKARTPGSFLWSRELIDLLLRGGNAASGCEDDEWALDASRNNVRPRRTRMRPTVRYVFKSRAGRDTVHFMYGNADGNAALARRLYQERYPQQQCPDRKTFVRLHYRLCEYGKFNCPGLGRGRPRSTTPEVQEEILEAENMTASISTRRVAPSTADYPARVRFYEAQFTRDGITNFHNQHVWAYENPRATVPSHHQVRFSLNMWAGIIGDRLVGPHVLVNRLTGQAYTNFLENTIPHVLEDTPLINRQHIHFLHDGAPAHFSRTARRYLDRRFPDRWIGRGGPIAWPPRSPDLNPLDFYL